MSSVAPGSRWPGALAQLGPPVVLLSGMLLACEPEQPGEVRTVELEDGQSASWHTDPGFLLLQLDIGSTLGVVRVFGDGRVAVHDSFAARGERETQMHLPSSALDDLVRSVLAADILRGGNVEAPYRRSHSTEPSLWSLRVRLEAYRDGSGGKVEPLDASFRGFDVLAGRGERRLGLAAAMAAMWELYRSPDLKAVREKAATGVPAWAVGLEQRSPRIIYQPISGREINTLRTIDWLGEDERALLSIRGAGLSLSPDGSSLAYVGKGGLTVRRLATGDERVVVTDLRRAHSLLWSPNGDEIAFSAEIGERYYHLFVAVTDGSGWRPWTDVGARPLAWSPDGRRIYYERSQRGVQQLGAHRVPRPNVFVIDRQGREPVPAVPWSVQDFRLSPDGRSASYRSGDYTSHSPERAKKGLLWVARLDPETGGRREGTVALAVGEGGGARWSADGRWLLYARGRAIERVRADGTGRRTLREETVGDRAPTNLRWSPDGRAILFVRRSIPSGMRLGGPWEIWIMGCDGEEPRYLATGAWAEWLLADPSSGAPG